MQHSVVGRVCKDAQIKLSDWSNLIEPLGQLKYIV